MAITYYASGSILNQVLGAVGFSAPSNYYLGLSTTSVSPSGSNASEPTGVTGYARVEVPNNKTYLTYASNGSLVNASELTFLTSASAWGTVVDVFLADTSGSGTGNIWFYEPLPSPRIVQDSTTISFAASALSFSMND